MASELQDQITALQDDAYNLTEGVNAMLLVLCGALVFLMHAGFAMVSAPRVHPAGCCRFLGVREAHVICFDRVHGQNATPCAAPQLCAGAIRSKNTMNILLMVRVGEGGTKVPPTSHYSLLLSTHPPTHPPTDGPRCDGLCPGLLPRRVRVLCLQTHDLHA
jgi:hypothetical protein